MMAVATMVVPFVTLGIAPGLVPTLSASRWDTETRSRVVKLGGLALLIAGLGGACVAASAGILNDTILRWENGDALFRAGGLLVLVLGLEKAFLELLRARGLYGWFSTTQVVQAILLALAAVAVLRGEGDVVAFVLIASLLRGGSLAVGFFLVISRSRVDPTSGPAPPSSIEVVRRGLPLSLAGLGVIVVNLGDRVVIGREINAEALGLYGAVYTIASLTTVATAPFLLPALPAMVRSHAESHGLAVTMATYHHFVVIVTVFMTFLLLVITPDAVTLLSGGSMAAGTALVGALALAMALHSWNSLAHYALIAAHHGSSLQRMWIFTGIGNVIVNLVVVPRHGILGAALVTLGSFILLEVMVGRAARVLTGSGAWDVPTTAKTGICLLPAAATSWIIAVETTTTWRSLFAQAATFAILGAGALLAARIVSITEFRSLLSVSTAT